MVRMFRKCQQEMEEETVRSDQELPTDRIVFVTDVVDVGDRLLLFGRDGIKSVCASFDRPARTVYLRLRDNCLAPDLLLEFTNMVAPSLRLHAEDFVAETVERATCFETAELPRKGQFLRVQYMGAALDWSRQASGRCYSKVLGTKTQRVEHFLLERKLRPVGEDVTEEQVLTALVSAMQSADPDVIIAHGLLRDLPLLMSRANALGVDHSGLGRLLHRSYEDSELGWSCQLREAFVGRIVVDLLTLSVDIQLSSRNNELSSLLESVGVELVHQDRLTNLFALEAGLEAIALVFALARLTSATPANVVRLGRAHRVEKVLAAEFHAAGFILPDKHFKKFPLKGNGFAGGLVLNPTVQVLREQAILLDFTSLYPSLIIDHQVCFTTPQLHPAFQAGSTGASERLAPVLPILMQRLLSERCKAAQEAKTVAHEAERRRFNTRVAALKMTSNAVYGCLGSTAGRFSALHLATFVAEQGRVLLRKTVDSVTALGFTVIYGDTDSVIVRTNTEVTEQSLAISRQVLREVNGWSPNVTLKLEAVFDRMLIASKKNYAARRVEVLGLHEPGLHLRGLIGNRTGNPRVLKALFSEVLESVWADDCQLRRLVTAINRLKAALPVTPVADLSASATVNRELHEYLAPPAVAVVAQRLVHRHGVRIGKGDSLEILPVMQTDCPEDACCYLSLSEVQQTSRQVDLQTWMTTYVMPALRQVTVGVSTFVPPLTLDRLLSFLGLSTAPFAMAEPLMTQQNNQAGLPVVSQGVVAKDHISVKCPSCQWSVSLNESGYNSAKKDFTLAKCQCKDCPWLPYQDMAYVLHQVEVTTFSLLRHVGLHQCGAQVAQLRKAFQVPAGVSMPLLKNAYLALESGLDTQLAGYPCGGLHMDFATTAAKELEQELDNI